MLSRRDLFTAGVAGSLTGVTSSGAAATTAQEADRDGQREIARQIQAVDDTLERAFLSNSLSHGPIDKIRDYMITFCRSHQKFPDFIEVGLGVFMELYDWHVRHRQQLVVQRAPDGRYWLQFMFTSMVLRPETESGYIGIPYDKG